MTVGPGEISQPRLHALHVDRELSKKAIARELGCSDMTVAAAVCHFGLTRSAVIKVSDEERRLIINLYTVEHLSARAIARRAAASRDEVLQTLRTSGVPLRGRGARPAELLDAEQLRQRYEAGASLRELAQDNKTDDGVIRDTLRGAGVHIRRRGPITRWQNILNGRVVAAEVCPGAVEPRLDCSASWLRIPDGPRRSPPTWRNAPQRPATPGRRAAVPRVMPTQATARPHAEER